MKIYIFSGVRLDSGYMYIRQTTLALDECSQLFLREGGPLILRSILAGLR